MPTENPSDQLAKPGDGDRAYERSLGIMPT